MSAYAYLNIRFSIKMPVQMSSNDLPWNYTHTSHTVYTYRWWSFPVTASWSHLKTRNKSYKYAWMWQWNYRDATDGYLRRQRQQRQVDCRWTSQLCSVAPIVIRNVLPGGTINYCIKIWRRVDSFNNNTFYLWYLLITKIIINLVMILF